MDLFHRLSNNQELIDFFCDLLEGNITDKKGYSVNIDFKKNKDSIFFFIDGSSILQIMPDKDLQYTYAHSPSYQEEIKRTISVLEKTYTRDYKIEQIIKKES